MQTGYQLPFGEFGAKDARATGFGTPKSDTAPQVVFEPPRRVIPVVFLPGIMGSNLVITRDDRIMRLGRDLAKAESNIAWRPDSVGEDHPFWATTASAADRQLALDPATTAVDVYNASSRRSDVDGDGRHRKVALAPDFDAPLLRDDPPGAKNRRTAAQKARARGWGEVYFDSYGTLLQRVESRLQRIFSGGRLGPGWLTVVDVDPVRWGLDPSTPQAALTEAELRAITKGTYFPVHAVGYNWLLDNRLSAQAVADRITEIVATYRDGARKHECPGVIVITHSMGGLLGRALVHPDMGGLQDLVLGMVHGVQPATGAAAAYARMHAGVEDPGMVGRHFKDSLAAKVLGNRGDEVTAVMASSAGGLQLLPNKAYGNGWLRVHHKGRDLLQLPSRGDPYEEIYKVRGKWYGLFPNEAWLNPAKLSNKQDGNALQRTYKNLTAAAKFHEALGDRYHPHTYAHYGADAQRKAFGNVTWRITPRCDDLTGWSNWPIVRNTKQGTVTLVDTVVAPVNAADPTWIQHTSAAVTATIDPPDEAGDQTVPVRSADHQLHRGKCKAVFRQTGYEHQGSYKDESVIEATLFSILKIAQRVQLP